jgi:hypothetical protein
MIDYPLVTDDLPTGRYADIPPVVHAGLGAFPEVGGVARQRIGVRACLRSREMVFSILRPSQSRGTAQPAREPADSVRHH